VDHIGTLKLLPVLELTNLKSLILRLNLPVYSRWPHDWTFYSIHKLIRIIEAHMSLRSLIIYWSPATLEHALWQGTDVEQLQRLDELFSGRLPDLFPLMKLVAALDLNQVAGLEFDEFCERVRVGMFPKCDHRGIVHVGCRRIGEDLLSSEIERAL
jgi:hypothetical protein